MIFAGDIAINNGLRVCMNRDLFIDRYVRLFLFFFQLQLR